MKKFPVLLALLSIALLPAFADEVYDVDAVFPAMAKQLSAAVGKLPKKTVAVYGFEVIGRPGDSYALYATEKLTHELVSLGKLLIIERSRLEEVLREQNFSLSVLADASTAARIGKLLAVDAVIIGSVRVTPGRTEFIARIIQSDTGIILASADEYVREAKNDAGNGNEETAKTAATDKTAKTAPTDQTESDSESDVTLTASKKAYKSTDEIVVNFDGLPGNEHDWISLVSAGASDDTYGEWFYTEGEESGEHTFAAVAAGEYEVRVYFDWPAGGYEVKQRLKITVK